MFQFDRPAWQDHAECAGVTPDLWFPEIGSNAAEAKKVCHRCPVRIDCLEHALAYHEKHGIWGGATVRERQVIVRQRRQRRQGL